VTRELLLKILTKVVIIHLQGIIFFCLLRFKKRRLIVLNLSLLTATFCTSQFIFSFFWGRLSDILGKKSTIILGLCGSIIAYLVFGFSKSYWQVFLLTSTGWQPLTLLFTFCSCSVYACVYVHVCACVHV